MKDKNKIFFHYIHLKRKGRSLLIVDARCVLDNDRDLRFIEHRLWNHSQHSTRPHESQFKFSVRALQRTEA